MTDPRSPFTAWAAHFARNPLQQQRMEATVDWAAPCVLPAPIVAAMARSFQRFALGESGDGAHLQRLAAATGDAAYQEAVRLLVVEEQRHSALFGRGLRHLRAPSLLGHWSDRVFTLLRRSLGLDTEIALFLVAETVALGYFTALAEHGPDAVLRGVGRCIVADEREHIRFQIDRLHLDLRPRPLLVRGAVGVVWCGVALGAATVLSVGHATALRACGEHPAHAWIRSLHAFGSAALQVLTGPADRLIGPSGAGDRATTDVPVVADRPLAG